MKVILLLFVNSLFAMDGGFIGYCQKAVQSELFRQLKQNHSVSDCQQLFDYLQQNKGFFIYCNGRCEIPPLNEIDGIKSFELINGQIEEIAEIGVLTSLQKVNLFKNRISNLTPIVKLEKLRELNLRENRCQSVEELGSLRALQDLDLASNDIEDISPLADLTNLRILDLSHNKIRDISPLIRLRKLVSIDLKGNPIAHSRKACPYGRGIPSAISRFCRQYLRRS